MAFRENPIVRVVGASNAPRVDALRIGVVTTNPRPPTARRRSMRVRAVTTITLLFFLAWFAPAASAAVAWEKGTFDEIMASAKKAGMPVMIDFFATWCGPCKLLEKTTYADPSVTAFSNKFVNAKFDVEKGEGIELAKRFKIMNYPTILFLKSNGEEIDRLIGYLPPKEFLQVMKDYYNGVNTLDDFIEKLEVDPDNVELVYAVAGKYVDRADRERAMPQLERVMSLDPENERGYAERAVLQMADVEGKAGNTDAAIKYARIFINDYPASRMLKDVFHNLAYYQNKAGAKEDAVGTYREMVAKFPEDTGVLNTFAWACAKNGFALEEGTKAAIKGVELSGEDPGILDTLAEVYYARGMYDDAIATINKAIIKDPQDNYLKEQLAKFKKAKSESRES